ncbi:MAG: hypothetical protein K2K75_04045, partial [Muribaculaceae bacterium]|nr:hypothetical protein [Muribaculaceae bacterium]
DMGSLFNNTKEFRSTRSKSQSKGQRLGWVHKSDYEPLSLRSVSSRGEKLHTYTTGPYSVNKLVP